MSAGPGWLQRSILDAVALASAPVPGEQLRWRIAEEASAGPVERLAPGFFRSFQRAIDGLRKRGRLTIDRRRLGGFDEVVRCYPGKAHEGWLRDLRSELLPALADWTSSVQGPGPRYTSAQSEEFYLKGLQPSEARSVQAAWHAVEDDVYGLMATVRGADRRCLLALVARCESLLCGVRPVAVKWSYGQLLQACAERNVVPPSLSARLSHLGELIAPPERFAHLRLKSLLHALVEMPDRGTWRLKDDTVKHLYAARPEVFESLPGFQPADPPRSHAIHPSGRVLRHSDRVYRLIDKSVCEEFTFLQVA